jgi:hypothetical protein
MSKPSDKAEENQKSKPRKPLEYRRFEKLLKQVVKSSPLRRQSPGLREREVKQNGSQSSVSQ